MNPTHMIRRSAVIVTWLPCVLLVSIAAAPAAFATTSHRSARHTPVNSSAPPGWTQQAWNKHPSLPAHIHTAVTGMPGWQIALIASGAAVLATVLAVRLARTWAARRRAAASPA
jgi:hypothetical protein